jgi:penicillin-binding protein 1A
VIDQVNNWLSGLFPSSGAPSGTRPPPPAEEQVLPAYTPPPPAPGSADQRWEPIPGARPTGQPSPGAAAPPQTGVVIGVPQGERTPQYIPLPPVQGR